jgi:hypothetical protein
MGKLGIMCNKWQTYQQRAISPPGLFGFSGPVRFHGDCPAGVQSEAEVVPGPFSVIPEPRFCSDCKQDGHQPSPIVYEKEHKRPGRPLAVCAQSALPMEHYSASVHAVASSAVSQAIHPDAPGGNSPGC